MSAHVSRAQKVSNVQMGGLCKLHNLVISGDTMGEVPGLSYSNQGDGLLSERNRLGRWQPHMLGFSWQRCPREAWCVCTAPKAGAAGSSSGLLWILSKPQDCSKTLGCLGYSLVDRP